MATLVQLKERTNLLKNKSKFTKLVLRTAFKFEAYLVDLNQIQLSNGLNIQGQVIGQYAKATEEIAKTESTREPKIAGDPFNFEWTGKLFDGMRIRLTAKALIFYSTDPKADLVTAKYGDIFSESVIFGLTQESLVDFMENKFIPAMQQEICVALGLTS